MGMLNVDQIQDGTAQSVTRMQLGFLFTKRVHVYGTVSSEAEYSR